MNRIRPIGEALAPRSSLAPRGRLATPSAGFARRIAGRFGRRAGVWERVSQLFARTSPGPSVSHRHDHRWIVSRFAPSFQLRVVGGPRGDGEARMGARSRRGLGRRNGFASDGAGALRLLRPAVASAGGVESSTRGSQRAGARAQRTLAPSVAGTFRANPTILPRPALAFASTSPVRSAYDQDAHDPGESLVPSGPARRLAPARVARVEEPSLVPTSGVVRRAPSLPAAATTTASADEWPPPRRGRRETRPSTGHREPQLDVQRVTDQVMRRIDRRLVAWRERTGRV